VRLIDKSEIVINLICKYNICRSTCAEFHSIRWDVELQILIFFVRTQLYICNSTQLSHQYEDYISQSKANIWFRWMRYDHTNSVFNFFLYFRFTPHDVKFILYITNIVREKTEGFHGLLLGDPWKRYSLYGHWKRGHELQSQCSWMFSEGNI